MSQRSDDIKEYIQYGICVMCIIGAMTMSFLAMYIVPTGEIHQSVLWLIAQVLVFCGSLLGINHIHNIQSKKINKRIDDFKPKPNKEDT